MALSDRLLEALLAEGAGEELITRINALLRAYDHRQALDTADWFKTTFPAVFGSRTPTGMKDLKADAEWLHRYLDFGRPGPGIVMLSLGDPADKAAELARRWARVKDRVAELVRSFSNEDKASGKAVMAELKIGGVTYINGVGFNETQLKKWATELNRVWDSVKGWRRKAITTSGGLKVKLARPDDFTGSKTASGKYRSSEDVLLVRATPNILKRTGGTYGAPDYILLHELGHRYERKVGGIEDFDKASWWTTKYSRSEGESFAELFALGHFGTGIQRVSTASDEWKERVDRFEQLMVGRVQENDIGHLHLLPRNKKLAKARVRRGDCCGDVIARGGALIPGYRSQKLGAAY